MCVVIGGSGAEGSRGADSQSLPGFLPLVSANKMERMSWVRMSMSVTFPLLLLYCYSPRPR
jgi:hypothetical protein